MADCPRKFYLINTEAILDYPGKLVYLYLHFWKVCYASKPYKSAHLAVAFVPRTVLILAGIYASHTSLVSWLSSLVIQSVILEGERDQGVKLVCSTDAGAHACAWH